jgi:hypothetical protein
VTDRYAVDLDSSICFQALNAAANWKLQQKMLYNIQALRKGAQLRVMTEARPIHVISKVTEFIWGKRQSLDYYLCYESWKAVFARKAQALISLVPEPAAQHSLILIRSGLLFVLP